MPCDKQTYLHSAVRTHVSRCGRPSKPLRINEPGQTARESDLQAASAAETNRMHGNLQLSDPSFHAILSVIKSFHRFSRAVACLATAAGPHGSVLMIGVACLAVSPQRSSHQGDRSGRPGADAARCRRMQNIQVRCCVRDCTDAAGSGRVAAHFTRDSKTRKVDFRLFDCCEKRNDVLVKACLI